MTPQQLHPSDDLQHRIEVLESKLAGLQVQTLNSRARRFAFLVSYALVPMLVFAGFALAQPEAPPSDEELRPDPDANDLIRNMGGITQVNAPFEVVDASGKIILSVGTADADAGVAIWVGEGSGALSVHSGDAVAVAELGAAENGNGILRANNAEGNLRAAISGEGVVGVFDESGETRLAVVDTASGRGRVAILGQGRAAAELTAAEAGGGSLVVHSSGGERIATVGVGDNGRGGVTIFQNGIDAAVLSTSDTGAGALSLQNAQGGEGLVARGGEGSFGGNVIAYNNAGEEVAGIGSSDEGKGRVVIIDNNTQVAVLKADENGTGSMALLTPDGKKGVEVMGQGGGESSGGSVMVFNQTEEEAVTLRVEDQGGGVIGVYSDDDAAAQLSGDSLELLDDGEPILSLESDPGQFAVFDEGAEAVLLGLNEQGMGQVILLKDSKVGVSLEVTVDGEGEVDVYGQNSGKPAAAMRSTGGGGLVAVTSSSGEVASEMSVSGDGRGQVVVWNPGGKVPAAIMTRSPDAPGGLVQVSNTQLGVSFLAVGPMGAGRLQLHDASGNNMVEAGTADDRGIVRVGPLFKCSPIQAATPVMAFGVPDCILGATRK